jgi:hypothetical protein
MLSPDAQAAVAGVLSIVIGLMWLWAGVAKLRRPLPRTAVVALAPWPMPPAVVSGVVVALPFVELAMGVMLLAHTNTRIVAVVSAGLLLVFAAAQIVALVRASLRVESYGHEVAAIAGCGCFGRQARTAPAAALRRSTPADLQTAAWRVARALVLAALSLAIAAPGGNGCPFCGW